MQPKTDQSYLPSILLIGGLLGSTLVVTRFSLGQFPTQTYVTMRLLVGSLAFCSMFLLFRRRALPRDRGLWRRAAIFGLIGTALTMTGYTQSLRYQSSGVTALLATLSPIETALLAHLFLKDEPIRRHHFAGALIAFAGAGLLLLRGESGLANLAHADWRGYAWALLGGLSNSAGLVYARKYLAREDPLVVTSIRIWVGAAVIATLTLLGGGLDLHLVRLSGLLALLYAGIAGTFLAFLVYMTTIQRFGATAASQSEYFVPMIASALGVALLGELFTTTMFIGMLLIFLGLAVFDRGDRLALRRSPAAG